MSTKFKIIPLLFALFCFKISWSQAGGNEIRAKVLSSISGINLENKILFVNVWQSDNITSREDCKEFIRVSNIYRNARLKNGLKGITFVNISTDKDKSLWTITVKKNGLESEYNLENSSGKYDDLINLFKSKSGNFVVNNNGELISQDLTKSDCFTFFHSLITR